MLQKCIGAENLRPSGDLLRGISSYTTAGELWLRLRDKLKAGMAFERAGEIFTGEAVRSEPSRPCHPFVAESTSRRFQLPQRFACLQHAFTKRR